VHAGNLLLLDMSFVPSSLHAEDPSLQRALDAAGSTEGEEDADIALAKLLQDQERAWFVANGGSLELIAGSLEGPSGIQHDAQPPNGYAALNG
jgi:hypothetical protein